MVQQALQTQKLHLGCGRTIFPGWINLDFVAGEGIDLLADLDNCATQPLDLPDDSIDEIFASHLIEHIKNPLPMMQELHRVAAPGCKAIFRMPHGSNDDAFEDPTHYRQYFANSFMYFSQPAYWRADYGYRGDWQATGVQLHVSYERYADADPQQLIWDVQNLRNTVLEMVVTLEAIKPIRPQQRDLLQIPTSDIVFVKR